MQKARGGAGERGGVGGSSDLRVGAFIINRIGLGGLLSSIITIRNPTEYCW